ncbi:MAG: hypothetical protein QRY16_12645 [Enterobacterales bacterium endosymbiont of Blomia tropicalis]|uniref:hypothetical protein n=1 Tax=Mixta mediterraneensis TaxID=2758443 RepID=UPI0025A91040|nr:hypothetical protein [Mixta mediterraneensis]MDL4914605.1 hypothetical protein [Mixta mediterraneensis]
MSDFILVDISAEAKVRYKKRVNMKREDYEKYLSICEEWSGDTEEKIAEIAVEYGFFAENEDIEDIDDPENVEFEPVLAKKEITVEDK